MPLDRASLWTFSALSASLAAGYGVLFTVVGDYRNNNGISETQVGIIKGVRVLAAYVAQVLIAPLADRGFARRLIIFGVGINIVGLVLLAFGESFWLLSFGRIISGIGIGAAQPAIRRIVIIADPVNVGENLGRLLSADVFGFAMGPAVSAILVGPFGLAAPFLVVAGATAALLWFALRLNVAETSESNAKRLALDLLKDRTVAGAVALGAAAFLMIGAFDALWDLVHEDLNTATWMANLGITLFAVPLVILGPTGGRLAQRVGPFRVGNAGILIACVFMAAYGLVPTGGWIFTIAMAHAVTDGLTIAASGVAIAMTVPEHRQAGAQGVMGAAQALVAGIAAIVTGGLYDEFGRTTAYLGAVVGMLAMAALSLYLAAPTWRDRAYLEPTPHTGPVVGTLSDDAA